MPVPVRIYGSGGQQADLMLNNTFNGEEFIVSVPFVVTGAQFDPNRHIISNNNSTTLGNGTFDLSQSVSLYPNPTNDILNVKLPNNIILSSVEIYNNLGQLVFNSAELSFSTSILNDGIYHVKIKTSEGVIHKNFIKK